MNDLNSMELKTIELNGLTVKYLDSASGATDTAVVFLHGWGSNLSVFKTFMDGLSGHFRVCALNFPGFGQSQEPPAAWGMDDFTGLTLAWFRALKLNRVILIGHSFGGRVIIKLAAKDVLPVTIEKIILVDSAGIRPPLTFKKKARQFFFKAVKTVISIPAVEARFPELLEQWRQSHGSADYRNASPRMRECLVRVINEDLSGCLPLIKAPALLVWGENDQATPLADARKMEQLIPGSGLAVLKNAGHYSFLDQSLIFSRILDSFLNIKR